MCTYPVATHSTFFASSVNWKHLQCFAKNLAVRYSDPDMSKLIGDILRAFKADRRLAPRFKAQRHVRLSFTLRISEAVTTSQRLLTFEGYTRDISEAGLALIVPSAGIKEIYRTGEYRPLLILLSLPAGQVEINAASVRCERLDEAVEEKGYAIGARIIGMSDHDRECLRSYLKTLR